MIETLRDRILIVDPDVKRRTIYKLSYGDDFGKRLNISGQRQTGLTNIEQMATGLQLVVADIEDSLKDEGVRFHDLVAAALAAKVPHVVVTTDVGKESSFAPIEGVLFLARNEVLRNLPQYFV